VAGEESLDLKSGLQMVGLLLALVSFFALAFGVWGVGWALWTGGGMLTVGMLLAIGARFLGDVEGGEDEDGGDDGEAERDEQGRMRS
jgi:hypothetical protein